MSEMTLWIADGVSVWRLDDIASVMGHDENGIFVIFSMERDFLRILTPKPLTCRRSNGKYVDFACEGGRLLCAQHVLVLRCRRCTSAFSGASIDNVADKATVVPIDLPGIT